MQKLKNTKFYKKNLNLIYLNIVEYIEAFKNNDNTIITKFDPVQKFIEYYYQRYSDYIILDKSTKHNPLHFLFKKLLTDNTINHYNIVDTPSGCILIRFVFTNKEVNVTIEV